MGVQQCLLVQFGNKGIQLCVFKVIGVVIMEVIFNLMCFQLVVGFFNGIVVFNFVYGEYR